MPYERSRLIEQRFQQTISIIREHCVNAGQLATELEVSRPTVHRIITELKRRGHAIRSVREADGWRYEISQPSPHDSEGRQ